MMQHVHILGAGWLGQPLAIAFANAGCTITCSNRSGRRLPLLAQQGIKHWQTDITQPDCDFTALTQCDVLIICITDKELAHYQRLVEFLRDHPVKRLIYTSSTSVYRGAAGSKEKFPVVNEHSECNQQHPLYKIEQCLQTLKDTEVTILRLSGLVNHSRHPGRFFQHKPIPNPDYPVNLVHSVDVIDVIQQLVLQQSSRGIFNICANSHPTKQAFYQHAAQQLGLDTPQLGADKPDIAAKRIDSQKIRDKLGYQFQYDDLMAVNWASQTDVP